MAKGSAARAAPTPKPPAVALAPAPEGPAPAPTLELPLAPLAPPVAAPALELAAPAPARPVAASVAAEQEKGARRTTIYFRPDVFEALRRAVFERRVDISGLVNEAVENYLKTPKTS